MSTIPAQETAALWLNQSKIGHKFEELASDQFFGSYGKALLIITKGDGTLAPAEREWVLGSLAAYGASASTLEALSTYEAEEELENVVTSLLADEKANGNISRTLVYNAFKACSADGAYNEGEKAAAYRYGSLLGISDDVIGQIEQLHLENEMLTEKKHKLLTIDERFG